MELFPILLFPFAGLLGSSSFIFGNSPIFNWPLPPSLASTERLLTVQVTKLAQNLLQMLIKSFLNFSANLQNFYDIALFERILFLEWSQLLMNSHLAHCEDASFIERHPRIGQVSGFISHLFSSPQSLE